MTISVAEAREQLDALVDAAAKGEEVALTRDGQPVACLVPAAPRRRQGSQPFPDLTEFRASIKSTGKPLSQVVIEEREASRY